MVSFPAFWNIAKLYGFYGFNWSSISAHSIEIIPLTGVKSFRAFLILSKNMYTFSIIRVMMEEATRWLVKAKFCTFFWIV